MDIFDTVSNAKVYDLAHSLRTGMSSSPNHPGFRMVLERRHGDMIREDGSSASSEVIVMGGHVGTHIDALAHVSFKGKIHGGYTTEEALEGGRFRIHGIDELNPILCRGILLDIPAILGQEVLRGGYEVTAKDLEQAALHARIDVKPGNAVLIRTGWARYFSDAAQFLGGESGVPGPGIEAVKWLNHLGVRVVGSDTTAFEVIPPGQGHRLLPVHKYLLVEQGINIIEMLNLEELSADRVYEFLFILSPLKIVGGTGSPVRPLGVVL